MTEEVTILIADDDDGHAALIRKNLRRAGLDNEIMRFRDGQEILDFLFGQGEPPHLSSEQNYLLLLDIRMPKIDGVEVLRQVKAHPTLKRLPVIMVTTTEDPREVNRCHELGCSSYVTKPVDYEHFVGAMRQLGCFLKVVRVPNLDDEE